MNIKNATRAALAETARRTAQTPFHGSLEGCPSNLQPIIALFPKWNLRDADRSWCAAFVFYCCIEAGFHIPYSPDECVTCSLAGCGGWEEFASGDRRIGYHRAGSAFVPEPGDIVLYDRVFCGLAHDHMGVVLGVSGGHLTAAEGNLPEGSVSGIVQRAMDRHIRAYIRIPDGYAYRE